FNPVETVSWILDGEMHYKIMVFSFSFGVFALFMNGTSRRNSGYMDASSHGAYGNSVFSDFDDLRAEGLIANKKLSKYSSK
ncbi:hypothetical protein OSK18_28425, partial [Escherichia coli]|nr:hypothetical protein [Escherichia coli]